MSETQTQDKDKVNEFSWDGLAEPETDTFVAVGSKVDILAEVPEPLRVRIETAYNETVTAWQKAAEKGYDKIRTEAITAANAALEAVEKDSKSSGGTKNHAKKAHEEAVAAAEKAYKDSMEAMTKLDGDALALLGTSKTAGPVRKRQATASEAMADKFIDLVKRYAKYRPDGQITVRASKDSKSPNVVRYSAKPLEKRETKAAPGTTTEGTGGRA